MTHFINIHILHFAIYTCHSYSCIFFLWEKCAFHSSIVHITSLAHNGCNYFTQSQALFCWICDWTVCSVQNWPTWCFLQLLTRERSWFRFNTGVPILATNVVRSTSIAPLCTHTWVSTGTQQNVQYVMWFWAESITYASISGLCTGLIRFTFRVSCENAVSFLVS